MNIENKTGERDFSLMEERDRRNAAGTLDAAPAKLLVVEDREAQLKNLAAGIADAKTAADPEQLIELNQLDRRVKRALGIRRLRPALEAGQLVTLNTEFGETTVRIRKVKADGSLRVAREDLLISLGEVVQLKAPIAGVEQLTDYVVSSLGESVASLRLLSPDEIEARKAAAQPEAVLTNLVNAVTGGVIARTDYNYALMKASTVKSEPIDLPSASQLARAARKLNRQQGVEARAAERRALAAGLHIETVPGL